MLAKLIQKLSAKIAWAALRRAFPELRDWRRTGQHEKLLSCPEIAALALDQIEAGGIA